MMESVRFDVYHNGLSPYKFINWAYPKTLKAYHFGWTSQKITFSAGSRRGSKQGGGWSCQSPVLPKAYINQRTLGETGWGWRERLELLLGPSISQWGTNTFCTGNILHCERHCRLVSTPGSLAANAYNPHSCTPSSVAMKNRLLAC